MVKIENIVTNSTAARADLSRNDKIIAINGEKINDYIDYLYQISEPVIELLILRENGQRETIQLQRKLGEELGIEFKEIIFDGLKQCKNNCIFCFVKQQPENMRESLNQKDDDYRFSFLQGSFVTLTNLDQAEIKRIIEKNLSPINISVHTTNPELRVEMMKNPAAAEIMRLLKLFQKNGIQFHTQIVLCPEYNDQEELDRTLADLLELYPELLSIGIVPVGLTKHRSGLAELRTMTKKEKTAALTQIKKWQQTAEKRYGKNFIYAADEFYLSTDSALPDYEDYHDFPQLENGIGLTALMNKNLRQTDIKELNNSLKEEKKIVLLSSELGAEALKNLTNQLAEIDKLEFQLKVIKNRFFGETVTVAGLLTAQDLKKAILKLEAEKFDQILIPKIVLNDEEKFLDGVQKEEFMQQLAAYNLKFIKNMEEFVEVIKDG